MTQHEAQRQALRTHQDRTELQLNKGFVLIYPPVPFPYQDRSMDEKRTYNPQGEQGLNPPPTPPQTVHLRQQASNTQVN